MLELQMQVQSLASQLKQAKAKPPEATATTAGAEGGDGETGAESAVKKRLDELDGYVQQLAGVDTPEVAKLVEQCKSEQEKPPSQRLKPLGFKITIVEQQITKQETARKLKQAQLVALQSELAKQDDALVESRKQLLELEGQRAHLVGALPQPPSVAPDAGGGESSWTLPKLEQVLFTAGPTGDLQQEVAAVVGKMRQHRQAQEQQAQAQREAQQKQAEEAAAQAAREQEWQDAAMDAEDGDAQGEESLNQATAEQLRDFLRQSGADLPNAEDASEEEPRAAVKRIRLAKPKWKVVKKPRTE
ncbi:unnamed protein product [Prorocentrum cordatum]|uniref:Uncharacterized protein n=1 Tax=Prorocentrum cordatum TaxID=2364126 RepID=A0ABN9R3Q4_9DINO|nr:unnamed protein product [Polarella glacialis]